MRGEGCNKCVMNGVLLGLQTLNLLALKFRTASTFSIRLRTVYLQQSAFLIDVSCSMTQVVFTHSRYSCHISRTEFTAEVLGLTLAGKHKNLLQLHLKANS